MSYKQHPSGYLRKIADCEGEVPHKRCFYRRRKLKTIVFRCRYRRRCTRRRRRVALWTYWLLSSFLQRKKPTRHCRRCTPRKQLHHLQVRIENVFEQRLPRNEQARHAQLRSQDVLLSVVFCESRHRMLTVCSRLHEDSLTQAHKPEALQKRLLEIRESKTCSTPKSAQAYSKTKYFPSRDAPVHPPEGWTQINLLQNVRSF